MGIFDFGDWSGWDTDTGSEQGNLPGSGESEPDGGSYESDADSED